MRYHLIGIGGAGMSAIAQILHSRGETVTGSDRRENEATRRLSAEGVKIAIGHSQANVNGAEVVVYTAAVTADNPEVMEARRRGIPLLERPAMLGRIMEPYKQRVAVSGTHGKTTTTSMISAILDSANLDASVLIGGDVRSMGGNARLGNGSIIITEACEAFESFLHLHPSIAVITNIDADHLDYYGTIEHIEDSFCQFISQVDIDGCVVANLDDPRARKVVGKCGEKKPGQEAGDASRCGRRVVWFGMSGDPDLLAENVDAAKPQPTYTLRLRGKLLGEVCLGVPGVQNVADSLAAAAVAFELGVGFEAVQSAMRDFRGVGRRFEILFDDGDVMVVDDYAHHPAELKATLSSARAAYDRRLFVIFQPHLFSRTKLLLEDFADALSLADEVVVAPIYAAREQPIEGVSGENLVARMKEKGFENVRYAPDKATLARDCAPCIKNGDMVLVVGAGDIRAAGDELASMLSAKAAK